MCIHTMYDVTSLHSSMQAADEARRKQKMMDDKVNYRSVLNESVEERKRREEQERQVQKRPSIVAKET